MSKRRNTQDNRTHAQHDNFKAVFITGTIAVLVLVGCFIGGKIAIAAGATGLLPLFGIGVLLSFLVLWAVSHAGSGSSQPYTPPADAAAAQPQPAVAQEAESAEDRPLLAEDSPEPEADDQEQAEEKGAEEGKRSAFQASR